MIPGFKVVIDPLCPPNRVYITPNPATFAIQDPKHVGVIVSLQRVPTPLPFEAELLALCEAVAREAGVSP